MAMSWYDNSHQLNIHELEYLSKVDWLWNQLSSLQRSKISSSVTSGTLRQENSRHCFIGEAIVVKNTNRISHGNSFVKRIIGFIKIIFYDGPSYDTLLHREVTREEKTMLNDIYYAKIGDSEYQYQRANELVRSYIANNLAII
ncbi:MAG: hypothetical protein KGH89_03365 [Thaumarchaeota archaeon]|nr:hypothetical protein [Nitrososphaerota archaeon]